MQLHSSSTTCLFSLKSVSKDVIRRDVQNIPPGGYNVIRSASHYDFKDEPAARHLMGIANCSSHPNGLSEHSFKTLLVRRFLLKKSTRKLIYMRYERERVQTVD